MLDLTRKLLGITLVLTFVTGVASGSHVASPQITDPAGDVHVTAATVDVPEPSVDVLSVTFGRSGDDLTVSIVVKDLDYVVPGATVNAKAYSVHFESDQHALVLVGASYDRTYGWMAYLGCYDESLLITCWHDLDAPVLDFANDRIVLAAPLDAVGGRVLAPSINTHVQYRNVPDAWPTFALQDYAPNCAVLSCAGGADYDPSQDA